MQVVPDIVSRFARDDSGATAIEYGFIATLIGVTMIGSLSLIGPQLKLIFAKIALSLK